MPYSDKEYKVSNVNYLNKDFSSFKNTLMEYAKTYFPNTYRDFNETSPGMMLIEMSAYVGDVLSFYIDQQYKEMMLPLAEERRNVINLANMLGYKVKPTTPSYVDLTFSQLVDADATDSNNIVPNLGQTFALKKGAIISSTSDSTIKFQTLDVVDFAVSGAMDTEPEINSVDSNGIVQTYKIKRKIKAISGEAKQKTFTVGAPQKFLRLTLPETNVIGIISVKDSADNKWHQVDYLAQDKVPIETHYTEGDDVRTSAYQYENGNGTIEVPVPYMLQYLKTPKRFITEINDDNKTSLVFGNGVLRSGQIQESSFIQLDQVGITIPGDDNDISSFVDPLNFSNNTNTLGESPSHTNIYVQYRVGGGITSNVPSGDLTTIDSSADLHGNSTGRSLTVTNESPARGGSGGETIDEIRRNAKAFFASQNRCVTQEDYEARVLSLPAKFGNIAKVFVKRTEIGDFDVNLDTVIPDIENNLEEEISNLSQNRVDISNQVTGNFTDAITSFNTSTEIGDADFVAGQISLQDGIDTINSVISEGTNTFNDNLIDLQQINMALGNISTSVDTTIGSIDVFILSYDNNKNLVTLPSSDLLPHPLQINLKNYLSQYRIISDEIGIKNGKVINFGVVFDVVAHRSSNKSDVKLRCIDTIKNYFTVDKMQFHQPLYSNDLEYELMGLDGVRAVNFIKLTQGNGSSDFSDVIPVPLWDFSLQQCNSGIEEECTRQNSGNNTDLNNNDDYGWMYDFTIFYGDDAPAGDGVILPSTTPSVFELKNPNDNIKGIVR